MKTEINDKAHELGLKYFPNEQNIWARENIEAIYCSGACIAMAEWVQKKIIEKACECIIKLHNWPTQYEEFAILQEEFITAFRKAMEE